MKIRQDSPLLKWAFLWGLTGPIPGTRLTKPRVSLCGLFWRTVAVTPVIFGLAGMAVGQLVLLVYTYPGMTAYIVLGGLFGIALAAGAVYATEWLKTHDLSPAPETIQRIDRIASVASLVTAYLKARKRRYCPFIEVV